MKWSYIEFCIDIFASLSFQNSDKVFCDHRGYEYDTAEITPSSRERQGHENAEVTRTPRSRERRGYENTEVTRTPKLRARRGYELYFIHIRVRPSNLGKLQTVCKFSCFIWKKIQIYHELGVHFPFTLQNKRSPRFLLIVDFTRLPKL